MICGRGLSVELIILNLNKWELLEKQRLLIVLFFWMIDYAQESPFFEAGEDPKPQAAQWKLVKGMSDEFDGN